ncbi:MAG: ECF transporter S component [Oscillospiraceae bacterium]|nr:ECF transporter S component [Oscillospiraceae bacterium]
MAVLTALSVAGRAAFVLVPFFKPVTAVVILAGVYCGGLGGCAVGVLSAAVSNIWFGQGPWTPFQMLAWGLIGLLAGVLPLRRSRPLLYLYGGLSGVVFSLVMDVWTVLWIDNSLSAPRYIAAVIAAAPVTVIYAVSNVVFLTLLTAPVGEKLDRIRRKYGAFSGEADKHA